MHLPLSPFDAVGVAQEVALCALLVVEEDDDGGDEVDDLARGQQVHVGPAVSPPVAEPDKPQSRRRRTSVARRSIALSTFPIRSSVRSLR